MYNLTKNQQELLRWIVQQVREGTIAEEFLIRHHRNHTDCSIEGHREWSSPVPHITQGMLDVFAASDLIIVKDGGIVDEYGSSLPNFYRCTLRGKAYEAVDSSFGFKIDSPQAPLLSIFDPPDKKYTYNLFVLMPFILELKPVYDDHIKKVAKILNLTIARADDFFSQNSIVQEVWSAIAQATILIADCTGKNPNVFYEIGIAHAINKPVILITQNPDDVPFDLRHRRYIKYSYTPRGMEQFENNLSSTILETKKDLGA